MKLKLKVDVTVMGGDQRELVKLKQKEGHLNKSSSQFAGHMDR